MSDARALMAAAGVVPKRSKGQNFLVDDRVADRIVGYAGITPGDAVLEVGPGFGILTERLIGTGARLTCVELDPKLAAHIRSAYGGSLELIEGDAVKTPFPEFDVFVSNLPYSVSTPIIFKLLEHDFRDAVVMVQREFADRMVADVGSPDYSRLTVNLFYRADCEILEPVPASRFDPRPKVDSAVVRIAPRPAPFRVLDEGTFFRVTEACFNHRRKKIGTSLRSTGMVRSADDVPYRDERIEDLRPSEIGEIADAVFTLNGRSGRRTSAVARFEIQHVVFSHMNHDLARRYVVLALGMIAITLGIGIITKASLGTSPITSIPYSLSMVLPLSLGEFTIIYSFLLVTLQGVMLWKGMGRTEKINLLLEYVVSVCFGYLVDFSMWLFADLNPGEYWLQIVCVLIGILVLAMGVYLQVVANVVMVPGDGFTYALTVRTRMSYGKVRVMSDSTMVVIAAVIGLVCLGNLGGVREGTVLCCVLTGMVSRFYMKHFGRLTGLLVPGKDLSRLADGDRSDARRRRDPRDRPPDPHHRTRRQDREGRQRREPGAHVVPCRRARVHPRQPRMHDIRPDEARADVASGCLRHR